MRPWLLDLWCHFVVLSGSCPGSVWVLMLPSSRCGHTKTRPTLCLAWVLGACYLSFPICGLVPKPTECRIMVGLCDCRERSQGFCLLGRPSRMPWYLQAQSVTGLSACLCVSAVSRTFPCLWLALCARVTRAGLQGRLRFAQLLLY